MDEQNKKIEDREQNFEAQYKMADHFIAGNTIKKGQLAYFDKGKIYKCKGQPWFIDFLANTGVFLLALIGIFAMLNIWTIILEMFFI